MYLRLALVMVIIGLAATWGAIIQRSIHTAAPPVAAFDDPAPLEQKVVDTQPKEIRIIPIVPQKPEAKAPEIKVPEVKVVDAQKPEPKQESNLCTRHKMHKVYTHGGRSWRCRR
jgi:hypothetical protein